MISLLVCHARRLLRFGEVQAAVVLGALVYVFSAHSSLFSERQPRYQHLGAEYYNIAVALAEGRGFSDPFAELSGSTAWMPPAYPALLATLLSALNTRSRVAEVVVYLSIFGLTTAGVIVFHAARRCSPRISPWWSVAFYGLWLWLHFDWFFTMTHDIWLLTLLVSLMLWSIVRFVLDSAVSGWLWGTLGGVVALSSPSLGAGWLALTGAALLLAAAVAFCIASPWVVRNAVVFQRLIPMKANVYYEAYQGNYADDDGIYDGDFKEHPFASPADRFRYTRLGEMAFLGEYETKFRAALQADPGRYLRNVAHRALAVTVHYVPNKFWQDEGFTRQLRQVVYCLPVLGLSIALLTRRAQQRLVRAIGLIWVVCLLPYVLVAFYLRYLMPVTSLLALMAFLGADQLAHAVVELRRRRGWLSSLRRQQS